MGHDRVMFGPFWDHILPQFTSRPATALQFSRLSHYGLRHLSIHCLLFGIMSVHCLNHTGTILLDQLKLQNNQDRVNMLQRTCVLGVYFFGQCQGNV